MQSNNVPDQLEGVEVTQGKYMLSIGTSLAFETLFGINDNITPTNPLPFTKYRYVLINIRTLIRNVYGAVAKELKSEWVAARYLAKVLDEIQIIPFLLENQSGGTVKAAFYLPSYKSVKKEYPNAVIREVTTRAVHAQHYEAVEQFCIAHITSKALKQELHVTLIDTSLPRMESRAAIITHMPIDLLTYRHSDLVDLVETHTGVIKPRNLWYTKLKGSNLERIPFDDWSIQWFGDGKTFTPYPPKYKKAVIELATEKKWNQSTTPRLIKVQLKYIPDTVIREALSKLM